PLPPAGQAKSNMTAHYSCEKQAPNVTSKYVDQSKFIPLEKQNLEYISQTTTTITTNTTKFSDSIMASTQHKVAIIYIPIRYLYDCRNRKQLNYRHKQ
ncbi:unnamed protein product, partial [Rotaria socialis]